MFAFSKITGNLSRQIFLFRLELLFILFAQIDEIYDEAEDGDHHDAADKKDRACPGAGAVKENISNYPAFACADLKVIKAFLVVFLCICLLCLYGADEFSGRN